MTHGGKRPGAGRKPRTVQLHTLTLRIEPPVWQAWQARKVIEAVSGPKLLSHLLTPPL